MSRARDLANLGADTTNLEDISSAYSAGALSNRNKIINGAMQVWQRGTSGAAGAPVYTVDRFKVWNTAVAQSTDVPSGEGFLYSTQLTVTTQTSGNFATIEQLVEFEKTLAGQTLAFSFWIKGSVSGTVVFRGYSQSNAAGFGHTAFSVTTSWQRVVVTFTVPALGGGSSDWCAFGIDFNVNNVPGLSYAGSGVSEPTYTGTIHHTGVQLEAGDTATPFEHRSVGAELVLCERYCQRGNTNMIMHMINAGLGVLPWSNCTEFRATPTATGPSSPYVENLPWNSIGFATGVTYNMGHFTPKGGEIGVFGSYSPTPSYGNVWLINASGLILSAEL